MIKHRIHYLKGFTITELIVATVVAAILLIALISSTVLWTQQFSITNVRQTLNTNAQSAVSRINDEMRNSAGVSLYNVAPDPNAPATLTGDFAHVRGPDGAATGTAHNWRMGTNRLIINQPARQADGSTIYSDPDTFTGPMNSIIYYVKSHTLYRRVVAAQTTSPLPPNSITTKTCALELGGGCAGQDTKVVEDLETEDGLGSFIVKYYDVGGEEIQPNTSGPTPDYAGFSATRMVSVDLKLNRSQVGQALVENNSGRMQFRTEPAKQVAPAPILDASITTGPGGIDAYWHTNVRGVNIKTQGRLNYTYHSKFGTSTQPVRIEAANKSCGSGNTFGTVYCAGQQPITTFWNSNIYGDVCATGQTDGAGILPGNAGTQYTQGRINGCVAPDVQMPKVDKAKYTSAMTASKPANEGSCNGLNGTKPTSTLEANTVYEGNVSLSQGCIATLKGDIYIKGSLDINYNASLRVDPSVTVQPMIIVDGGIRFFWGSNVVPNGNVAPFFVSFLSSDNGCNYSSPTCCTKSPTCNTISNATLESSYNQTAIEFTQTISAPYASFYAHFGKMTVFWSDLNVGAVAGQRVEFNNSGSVTLSQ